MVTRQAPPELGAHLLIQSAQTRLSPQREPASDKPPFVAAVVTFRLRLPLSTAQGIGADARDIHLLDRDL